MGQGESRTTLKKLFLSQLDFGGLFLLFLLLLSENAENCKLSQSLDANPPIVFACKIVDCGVLLHSSSSHLARCF